MEAEVTTRVAVRPQLLEWARERARLDPDELATRFPQLASWVAGERTPTIRQLEAYAAATYTPFGYFLLPDPPAERVPIPDYRTMADRPVSAPSANLLETINVCLQRQEWYRDHARATGEVPLEFIGSVEPGADVVKTAADIRLALGFDLEDRRRVATWEEALRQFVELAENIGILVMTSGVVLNNTHRPLDLDEFRGFALADPLAPVLFVNGTDTKSGQMFTIAHELVHLWVGQTGVDDAQLSTMDDSGIERWCNQVAAEILVPATAMRDSFDPKSALPAELQRLARRFKVSTLVILRRAFDVGGLSREAFWVAYQEERNRLREIGIRTGAGGNFHYTEAVRVSRRFARALVSSTIEGTTLYRDAFRMLGFRRLETFREFGRTLGVLA